MKHKFLAIALFAASSVATAAGETIWSPDQNVICDKIAGYCADDQGLSVAYTQEYLGAKAAQKLMAEIKKGGDDFDSTTFTFSNGARCDTNARKCVNRNTGKIEPITDGVLFHQ